jgi:predicted transposase/invertase (TIGR01784 family)
MNPTIRPEPTINNIPDLLPLTDDHIFKTLLTKPESDIIRNEMISAFTGIKVVQSTVIQNEPPIDTSTQEKQTRLDVNCVTEDGKQINIEMQANPMKEDRRDNTHENLRARSLYYATKLFAGQAKQKFYSDLKLSFQIMVCDFQIWDDDRFIRKFVFSDGVNTLSELCCIIYVELPKIKDKIDRPFEDLTEEERWALYIEYANRPEYAMKIREFEQKEAFKMASDMLSNISQNDKQRFEYISRLKYEWDLESNLAMERRNGFQEGEEVGIVKGAYQNAIAMAKEMLLDNYPLPLIAKYTKLSQEQISSIKI